MPPLAASVALYAVPTCPLGRVVVAIDNVVGAMVIVRVADWLCAGLPESVTLKVSEMPLAVAVGVPVIAPVAAFRVRPAGSVPEVNDQL